MINKGQKILNKGERILIFLEVNKEKMFKSVEIAKYVFGDENAKYQVSAHLDRLKREKLVVHRRPYWGIK